jgi:hypothetical protein
MYCCKKMNNTGPGSLVGPNGFFIQRKLTKMPINPGPMKLKKVGSEFV